MKVKNIQPGKTYRVKLNEQDSGIYKGCTVNAQVVRAGFHYEIEEVHGSRIRGAPFHRYHESLHPSGVEVTWDEQDVWSNRRHFNRETALPGRAIINARNVLHEVEEEEANDSD